jgi:hypothetical protein
MEQLLEEHDLSGEGFEVLMERVVTGESVGAAAKVSM